MMELSVMKYGEIAVDFNRNNDSEFGDYIMALLSDKNTFVPQVLNGKIDHLRKIECPPTTLPSQNASRKN